MFGNDKKQDDQKDQNKAQVNDMSAPLPPNEPDDSVTLAGDVKDKPVSGTGSSSIGDPTPPPDAPLVTGSPKTTSPVAAPSVSSSQPVNPDGLFDIKKDALQQLSPLVSHLDQTPEEKFRTTMMLIQATDDSSMVKEAFAAAKQITDDKARAQALLDVINEINYFTQQKENNS